VAFTDAAAGDDEEALRRERRGASRSSLDARSSTLATSALASWIGSPTPGIRSTTDAGDKRRCGLDLARPLGDLRARGAASLIGSA
jgi:hypothetical protein